MNQMELVHGSLFSGFDAPSVAASWMGWENAFHCEINDFCNEILKYWFPNSEHYEDITKTDFSQWRGRIDILTGGFPCQPFSVAGQRKGADDNRYLWPHMLRAIREIQPTWVIGENVAGILTMVQPGEEIEMGSQASLFGEDNRKRVLLQQEYVVETICKDLEREGYSVQPMLIPACAVGAPHRRDRMWFVAHRNNVTDSDICSDIGVSREDASPCRKKWLQERNEIWKPDESDNVRPKIQKPSSDSQCSGSRQIHEEVQPEKPDGDCVDCNGSKRNVTYSNNKRLQGCINFGSVGKEKKKSSHEQFNGSLFPNWKNFPTQSPVCRGNDGLPFDVDDLTIPFTKWRQESVKGYGNAIVPQVILEIFKAIEEVEQLE